MAYWLFMQFHTRNPNEIQLRRICTQHCHIYMLLECHVTILLFALCWRDIHLLLNAWRSVVSVPCTFPALNVRSCATSPELQDTCGRVFTFIISTSTTSNKVKKGQSSCAQIIKHHAVKVYGEEEV
jgi:hypothetical protein